MVVILSSEEASSNLLSSSQDVICAPPMGFETMCLRSCCRHEPHEDLISNADPASVDLK